LRPHDNRATGPRRRSSRGRVALATCAELPELEDDDRLLLPALAELGLEAEPVVWDDPSADWGRYELTVIRNTWDYVGRREQFLGWARSAGRVANPPGVLEWSTDKRYLAELRAAGLAIVPTMIVEPGERFPVLEGEVVVKPVESAGARDTERYDQETEKDAARLATRIHTSGRAVMVQPYIRGVEGRGETALIYFGGEFSHAIHKGPLLAPDRVVRHGLFVQEDIASREPTAAERALGDAVMAHVTERFGVLAYARVDLLPALGGHLVLEAELAEPSLFLGTSAGAAQRAAAAIAAVLE
jgi:glutathione synthase/RimK-type ligase-like ATP-grasp enzyme